MPNCLFVQMPLMNLAWNKWIGEERAKGMAGQGRARQSTMSTRVGQGKANDGEVKMWKNLLWKSNSHSECDCSHVQFSFCLVQSRVCIASSRWSVVVGRRLWLYSASIMWLKSVRQPRRQHLYSRTYRHRQAIAIAILTHRDRRTTVESTVFGGGTMAMMAALASLFLLVTLASSGEILDSRPPLITFLPRNCSSYFEISQKQKTVNTIYCESVNLGFYRLFCGKLFSKEKHINSFLCLFHCLRIESKKFKNYITNFN